MNFRKSIRNLSKTQRIIWLVSAVAIGLSFGMAGSRDYMTLAASLVGATALVFLAKGDAFGQLFTIVFALLYGIVSFGCRYYGEMITYLFMTLPSAAVALVNWLRHPYAECEVKVGRVRPLQWLFLVLSSIVVTLVLGRILAYFHTANLGISTLSVTASYLASVLTIFRSPYYAVAYACNDVVLIVLWTLMTMADISYLPMIICFAVFLVNDLYGFANWQVMKRQQEGKKTN